MSVVLTGILLVLAFWLYLTVSLAPAGFVLLVAAVMTHVARPGASRR